MLERLRQWLGLERRSVDYADPALQYLYGGSRTSAGEPVSLERAAGLTSVWSCVALIAGAISSMPLVLYRRTEDGGRERYVDHPPYDVLRTRPNPAQSVVAFWEAMVTALLLRGNAYAMITRDDDGRTRALWYTSPDRVTVEVLKTGRVRYKVSPPAGAPLTVPEGQMLHATGPLSPDGVMGRSVVATFRETLGLALGTERYASEFFANAATPKGVLTSPGRLSPSALTNLRQALVDTQTTPGRRHRTVVLEEGMTWQAIGINHEDSQLLESRRFSTEEIARIFNVPLHMISGATSGSTMTYANAESRALDFVKFCLGPWLARIESAVNFSCISPLHRRQMYAEYLPDALLATDTASRYAAYKTGLEAGFLTLDEVRAKENLPALPERVPTLG
jgi:HK97 family phage portal protein